VRVFALDEAALLLLKPALTAHDLNRRERHRCL